MILLIKYLAIYIAKYFILFFIFLKISLFNESQQEYSTFFQLHTHTIRLQNNDQCLVYSII